MKKCPCCGKIKNRDAFYKMSIAKDGLQRLCKKCDRERIAKLYQDNLEENRLKRKIWQEQNRELHNSHARSYYGRKKIF